MNREYFTGIPHRIYESIIFSKCNEQTKKLALLLTRFLYGFPQPEIKISNPEIKAFGIAISQIPTACERIDKNGWFSIEYVPGLNGHITARRTKPSQIYLDQVQDYTSELIREIGLRSYKTWEEKQKAQQKQ